MNEPNPTLAAVLRALDRGIDAAKERQLTTKDAREANYLAGWIDALDEFAKGIRSGKLIE